jgi:hypothetical protein
MERLRYLLDEKSRRKVMLHPAKHKHRRLLVTTPTTAETAEMTKSYVKNVVGGHPEPVEGRRAQWPIRVLSIVQRPCPRRGSTSSS